MADLKISGAPAVVTLAETDEYATNQGGASKRTSLAQILNAGGGGGGLLTAEYRFDTSIVAADPGSGKFRYNNATPASVTNIFIDDLTSNGTDISNLLGLITTGDRLYIQTRGDSAEFMVFNVSAPITDNTGWFTIVGTVEASGDLHANNARCLVALQIGGAVGFVEINDLSAAVVWANIPDANVPESAVTQHEAALTITESQISDLQAYLLTEANDLSAAVVWANIPDANVPESAVTQHEAAIDHDALLNFLTSEHFAQAAISIPASQISDFDTEVGNNASVTANTAKVTNATHTGQVTGSGALALDITAVTDQPPAGALAGADTVILNDGGVLSEATMDQIATFVGSGSVPDPLLLNAGSVANPTYSFSGDSDTGFFNTGADVLGLAAGGVEIARAVEAAEDQFIISPGALLGSPALPSLAWGDGDTGFNEGIDDNLGVVIAGTQRWFWEATAFAAAPGTGPKIESGAASALVPGFIPRRSDPNTGLASAGLDILTFPVGGIEALRLAELSSHIIQTNENQVGLTASVTQTQAGGLDLLSSYNEISTVANSGDALTAFVVVGGVRLVVINNGANDLQLFPASGDDLGAGVDTSITIGAGAVGVFIGRDATNWDVLFNASPTPGGGGGLPEFQFSPLILENPNNADWTVNALAPAVADSNNNGLTVRAFDDTAEEGVGFQFEVPAGATNIVFAFRSRAETTPGGAVTVGLDIYNRGIPDNAAVQAWSSATQLTDLNFTTNEFFQEDSQSVTLATLGITAGELTQFELVRVAPTGGSDLTGDWILANLKVSFT